MSLDNVVRAVVVRLSLREPQAESLRRLASALEAVPALRNHRARSPEELAAMIAALQAQFPMLADFERDFPSLCFALATGVGKTRLMGAFIGYLHAAYGYCHFFVLAPKPWRYLLIPHDAVAVNRTLMSWVDRCASPA